MRGATHTDDAPRHLVSRLARCGWLTETLGLHGAVDYKRADEVGAQLDALAPDGIDFIYDNAGGETLDHALRRINAGGRVVICGAVSQYSGNLNHGKVRTRGGGANNNNTRARGPRPRARTASGAMKSSESTANAIGGDDHRREARHRCEARHSTRSRTRARVAAHQFL